MSFKYYQQNIITRSENKSTLRSRKSTLCDAYARVSTAQMFGVQLYKNNARAILSRILSILNLDWLQHARSVRGVCEFTLILTLILNTTCFYLYPFSTPTPKPDPNLNSNPNPYSSPNPDPIPTLILSD